MFGELTSGSEKNITERRPGIDTWRATTLRRCEEERKYFPLPWEKRKDSEAAEVSGLGIRDGIGGIRKVGLG